MSSILWFLIVAAVFIFLIGIRIVRPTHRGLIERLGRYQRFASPGFTGSSRWSSACSGWTSPSR